MANKNANERNAAARAALEDRIVKMRQDWRDLMRECAEFGGADADQFIDKGIPQSQLFMVELIPFIHERYMSLGTNARKSVLDIGPQSFGGTKLLQEIHSDRTHCKLKLDVTALDIVSNFKLVQKMMVPDIEFLIQDIYSIEDRQWDFVICSHVVEHVPEPLDFIRRCQQLARDFVLVACPWEEFPLTNKGHVNTIGMDFVRATGGEDLKVYKNYMWGKKRDVCIFVVPGLAK